MAKTQESLRSIQLRSQRVENLSRQDVKAMLLQYNFYCGEYQWSKPWCNPNCKSLQHDFELQHDGQVVIDHTTGLMWQQSGSANYLTFVNAEKYIYDLNAMQFCGYVDWRLPTLEEAMSLMECEKKSGDLYIDRLFDRRQPHIWTVDKEEGTGWIWLVSFNHGGCNRHDTNDENFVRAVRS